MYEKLHFISRNWRKENSSVACGSSLIKIHYFDYPKRFINRIIKFFLFVFFFKKYRYKYMKSIIFQKISL